MSLKKPSECPGCHRADYINHVTTMPRDNKPEVWRCGWCNHKWRTHSPKPSGS